MMAAASVVVAAALDRLLAEPPLAIHPVALFGRVVSRVDRPWVRPRLAGAAIALALPLAAGVVVAGGVALAGSLHPVAALLASALALFSTTSLRMLLDEARGVVESSGVDLAAARRDLRALAGRPAESLSAGQVRSAAVESAAENLADGLVAPLGGFAVGAVVGGVLSPRPVATLALGAGVAAWVKAVNTLDSVLGYPDNPHGTASARLDDVVMFLPARLSALLLALVAGGVRAPSLLWRAHAVAREPASPNSGWPMATLAAALSVRLEKPDHYVLDCGPALPSSARARRGVRHVSRAGWLAVALAALVLVAATLGTVAPTLVLVAPTLGTVAPTLGAVSSASGPLVGVVPWY